MRDRLWPVSALLSRHAWFEDLVIGITFGYQPLRESAVSRGANATVAARKPSLRTGSRACPAHQVPGPLVGTNPLPPATCLLHQGFRRRIANRCARPVAGLHTVRASGFGQRALVRAFPSRLGRCGRYPHFCCGSVRSLPLVPRTTLN